jgi:site-specific DNA-methyltransferase (adenine-specific)
MKKTGNDGTGNTIERDEWQTPQQLFNVLNKQYIFEMDCCAKIENTKCKYYMSNFISHFREDILDFICWMNPPFSKAETMFSHFFKEVTIGVAIYRCDNFETKIWQNIIFPNATWIFVPSKRIAYEGINGKGSRFPSALIGLNVEPPNNIKGTLLKPTKQINTIELDNQVRERFLDESNYNNCDKTSGQIIHSEEEIRDILLNEQQTNN